MNARSVDRAAVADVLLAMLAERGAARTLDPTEVARALAGPNEKLWRLMMAPIRTEAVRLAREGRLEILRKGRPVDPGDFKGIYRLRMAQAGETGGQ